MSLFKKDVGTLIPVAEGIWTVWEIFVQIDKQNERLCLAILFSEQLCKHTVEALMS
jgi:hypothetical protein